MNSLFNFDLKIFPVVLFGISLTNATPPEKKNTCDLFKSFYLFSSKSSFHSHFAHLKNIYKNQKSESTLVWQSNIYDKVIRNSPRWCNSCRKLSYTFEFLVFGDFSFYEVFNVILGGFLIFFRHHKCSRYFAISRVRNTNHCCLHHVRMRPQQRFQFRRWNLRPGENNGLN